MYIKKYLFILLVFTLSFTDCFSPLKKSVAIKKVIIIGASSGIGAALAKELAHRKYIVGICGRRAELLKKVQEQIPTKTYSKVIDISIPKEAHKLLKELINERMV